MGLVRLLDEVEVVVANELLKLGLLEEPENANPENLAAALMLSSWERVSNEVRALEDADDEEEAALRWVDDDGKTRRC